jgi:hypothetical protein
MIDDEKRILTIFCLFNWLIELLNKNEIEKFKNFVGIRPLCINYTVKLDEIKRFQANPRTFFIKSRISKKTLKRLI